MKIAICLTPLLFAGLLYGQVNQKSQEFGVIATSGQSITFQDPPGSGTLTMNEVITGSPSAMSVIVQGCSRGGTCATLDTYTGTTSALRGPLTGGYDNYVVTATWTGTSSVTVYKTGIMAKVNSGGGGSGVASIDGQTGAFTFNGAGVSHSGTTYTFTGGGGGAVSSVNAKTGAVVLTYSDVGAEPAVTLSPLAYGAVCDGSSHPASGKYANLAATQVDFPFATAQTNELDWLAIQKAINIGAATTTGGTVFFPGKTSCIMDNASSAADGSGTLTLPEANDYLNGGSVVNLVGQGQYSTTLRWNFDLGAGKFAILDANRIASTAGNMGYVGKLTIAGPGNPSPTVGTFPANMGGFAVGSYKRIQEFAASGFRYGIAYAGGQQRWSDVTLMNNGYNIYAQNSTGGLLGDLQWDRIVAKNATLADFAAAHDADFVDLTCIQCYAGYAPYAFFKETNSGAPTNALLMNRTRFLDLKAEFVGNALIADDQNSASSMYANILDANFDNLWFSWGATFQWGAKGRFALVNVNNASFSKFTNINTSGSNWVPGSVSIFNIANVGGQLELSGDINALIANANAAGANSIFNNHPGNILVKNTSTPSWSGFVTTGQSFVTLASGQFAVGVQNAFFPTSIAGVPASGNTADVPMGVVMHVDGGNTATGAATIFANLGTVTVSASGTYPTASGAPLRTGAGGTLAAASSSGDTTSPIVGSITAVPGSSTPTTVSVNLNGGLSSGGVPTNASVKSALALSPNRSSGGNEFYGDSLVSSGTATNGDSGLSQNLGARLANDLLGQARGYAVSGTYEAQIVDSILTNHQPNLSPTSPATVIMDGGVNDANVIGATTGGLNNYRLELNAGIAWASLSSANRVMASAATPAGTWAAYSILPLASQVVGTAMSSTTNGSTLTFTTPGGGTKTGITYYAPTTTNGGTFTVSIGGTPQTDVCSGTTTFASTGCNSVLPTGLAPAPAITAFRQEFTTSGAAQTVVITVTSATSASNVVFVNSADQVPASKTGLPIVIHAGVIRQLNDTSSAATAAYNTAASTVITTTSAWANTFFVDTRTGTPAVNTTTDMANNGNVAPCPGGAPSLHPNKCGYDNWVLTVENAPAIAALNIFYPGLASQQNNIMASQTIQGNQTTTGTATATNFQSPLQTNTRLATSPSSWLLTATGAQASSASTWTQTLCALFGNVNCFGLSYDTVHSGLFTALISEFAAGIQFCPHGVATGATTTGPTACLPGLWINATTRDAELYGNTKTPTVQFGTTTAGPCSSTLAGQFQYTQGNATTPDLVEVCAHDANNAYAWRQIATQAENTVSFSATPTFAGGADVNTITLTGNVTSFTMPTVVPGRTVCLKFIQDATGSRTVAGAPASLHGFFTIGATASTRSLQCYVGAGAEWDATGPGVINLP